MLRLVSLGIVEINLYGEGISYIYAEMLKKNGITFYNHIQIIQTCEKDQNLILPQGKDINIKLTYDDGEDFSLKDDYKKQLFFVDVVHTALLFLAARDNRLDVEVLNSIKAEILSNNFNIPINYKSFISPKNELLKANVIVHPLMRHFNVYLEIEKSGELLKSLLIYKGKPTTFYLPDYFSKGKWSKNNFVLSGRHTDMEISLSLTDFNLEFINKSGIEGKAPKFELMKADSDKATALSDYLQTLNPAIVAVLTSSQN
ncbi:hypothetical protein [Chitinophaga solisilvae]|uniref:hypothetical protein n=1 Tax=Chitinophaga solisilvae TaxID=1233460 RepID=UPI00136E1EBE|nr:hypothetical protein [Chitinophaga solisilvae]